MMASNKDEGLPSVPRAGFRDQPQARVAREGEGRDL